jgi:drug/metabolite transporter (DMT)-like permease
MSLAVACLVLGAALLHATWNAMLRSSGDRFLSMVVIDVTSGAVVVPFLFGLPPPAAASWSYIVLSAVIHVGYSLFLINIYKQGELGQVYPIARGSSPLVVTIGGMLFAGEHLTPLTLAGIALISFGIVALAKGKNSAKPMTVFAALVTGVIIGSYTIVDGIGSRNAGDALSYSAWMFALYGAMMLVVYFLKRNRPKIHFKSKAVHHAMLAGMLSLFGYCIVIWAISIGPMGPVSALRETSVVFAAFIGWFCLKEKLTARRIAACTVIALGTVCLG